MTTDTSTATSRNVGASWENESGPKPSVGSTRRGLTQAIDSNDWRAAVQSTEWPSETLANGRVIFRCNRRHMHSNPTSAFECAGDLVTEKVCIVDGCAKPSKARGMCGAHHERWRINGDGFDQSAIQMHEATPGDEWERIAKRVVRDEETGCLRWTGVHTSTGYGQIRVNRKMVQTHRISYEHHFGQIPVGYEIDHVYDNGCRHHDCCEPSHLEAVTPDENKRRYWCSVRGEKHDAA